MIKFSIITQSFSKNEVSISSSACFDYRNVSFIKKTKYQQTYVTYKFGHQNFFDDIDDIIACSSNSPQLLNQFLKIKYQYYPQHVQIIEIWALQKIQNADRIMWLANLVEMQQQKHPIFVRLFVVMHFKITLLHIKRSICIRWVISPHKLIFVWWWCKKNASFC